MTIDERARHDLYDQLTASIGADAADTLMGYLPPVGWADVATKRDLDLTKSEILATLRGEMADLRGDLRGEMAAQTRTLLFAMVSVMLVLSSTILAAVKL